MDRNLALEMIRVTEAAALAAARWMGKGDALSANRAASESMHHTLNNIPFSGRIVLGDGDRNSVPRLYTGEKVGAGGPDHLDLAVDPLECTRSVAFGRSNAMAVVALAPSESFHAPPSDYAAKIAVGADAVGVIDLSLGPRDNLERIAEAKGYAVRDLTVVILDRARHADLIDTIRRTGARIHLIPDGDVAAAIAAATPGTGIDVLMGVGGSAAGVLAAAAMRCVGGEIMMRAAPLDRDDEKRLRESGHVDLDRVYRAIDLSAGDNIMFAATGVTDGDLLNGVHYRPYGATTHSLVMRSRSGTRRFVVTEHHFEEKPDY